MGGEVMLWFLMISGLMTWTENVTGASCPIVMSPAAVVVRFGDAFSVNCTSLSKDTLGMGWESSAGGTELRDNVSSVPLYITSVTDWNLSPQCYVNLNNDIGQCSENLPVTVYKMMDSVSMAQPSETGPMVEGKKYHMQCDVTNVAPAGNLTVYWHKGNKIIHKDTFTESSRAPVNISSICDLTASRDDNGAHVWCEAKLNFMQSGPNLSPMHSKSREVTVLYPPTFSKPANEMVNIEGQGQLILNCTATGNPMPIYSWQYPQPPPQATTNQEENQPILALSFPLPGTYNCTVSNSQGTRTKHFTVIKDENRTTFTALVVGFVLLGVMLAAAGLFLLTPNGTFSFNKCNYQPTPSGPV